MRAPRKVVWPQLCGLVMGRLPYISNCPASKSVHASVLNVPMCLFKNSPLRICSNPVVEMATVTLEVKLSTSWCKSNMAIPAYTTRPWEVAMHPALLLVALGPAAPHRTLECRHEDDVKIRALILVFWCDIITVPYMQRVWGFLWEKLVHLYCSDPWWCILLILIKWKRVGRCRLFSPVRI